jgi:transcriptional regulator with XRE-family HTH domain
MTMNCNFQKDMKAIREILRMTQEEFAEKIGVEQATISRNELGKNLPSPQLMERVYQFAFDKKIQINQLKKMLWVENLASDHKLLFHGAKSEIAGEIDVTIGRTNNDFGCGFYTGESYDQSISFISNFNKSCVYFLDFNNVDLRCKKYNIDQEWMMTIAYYRNALSKYAEHPIVQKLVAQSRDCDYIIAPIADNRMFQIINSFIDGEITDEQCKHFLAATNLGYQYVFVTPKSTKHLRNHRN